MATALSPEVHLMRRRLRHVHIPDLPPTYAPRSLAGTIRDHIQGQITRQRAVSEQPPLNDAKYGLAKLTSGVQTSFTSWVKQAGPPPMVLSFTRRPTYILPKHQMERQEPWQVEYLTKALKSRMNLHFPEPSGWSSLPWRPHWERNMDASEWKLDPLNHQWPHVGVLIMPCAEAMFLGPGQVSIWPIIDLKDDIQQGPTKVKTKYEFERILEDTTIELLKREFGIQAFAIPGSTGVWVESRIPPPEVDERPNQGDDPISQLESFGPPNRRANVRRIATVHTSITKDITQWGVSIHVGQPDPTSDSWTRSTNPWTPIRQHNTTTSIAAELAYMKSSASPLGPSKYLFTYFNQKSMPARAGQGAMPYSQIKADSGRRSPAPLGMDNRDISTAWTYEFARQLGMKDGHVDHYSMVEADDRYASSLPTTSSGPGFRFKGVFAEDVMNSSYRQVDVPGMMVSKQEKVASGILQESMRVEDIDGRIDSATHDGWLLSWPLWRDTLLRKLDEAICGGPCDTRLKVYGMQKQVSSKLQRRRNELQQVKKVEQEWRADMPHLVRRPLTDDTIRELADRSREMESILKTVRMGTKSVKLLDSTIQIRRLLERRFAGAFSRNAGATESAQDDPVSDLEAGSGASPLARTDASIRKKIPKRPLGLPQGTNAVPPSGQISSPQVRAEEPGDLIETKAKQHIREPQDRVGDRRKSLPYTFTKTRAELYREEAELHRQKAEKRARQAEERLEAARKHLDAENNGLERGRELMERLEEAKKLREAASKQEQVSSAPKGAGEGIRLRRPPRVSRFLPNTHQIGES